MLLFLKETTFTAIVRGGNNSTDDDEEDDEDGVVEYTGQKYAVDKSAPANQYGYARTSVKFTEHILRRHSNWMIR